MYPGALTRRFRLASTPDAILKNKIQEEEEIETRTRRNHARLMHRWHTFGASNTDLPLPLSLLLFLLCMV